MELHEHVYNLLCNSQYLQWQLTTKNLKLVYLLSLLNASII